MQLLRLQTGYLHIRLGESALSVDKLRFGGIGTITILIHLLLVLTGLMLPHAQLLGKVIRTILLSHRISGYRRSGSVLRLRGHARFRRIRRCRRLSGIGIFISH